MWFFNKKKDKKEETKEERETRIKKEAEDYVLKRFNETLVKESYDKHGWIPFLY